MAQQLPPTERQSIGQLLRRIINGFNGVVDRQVQLVKQEIMENLLEGLQAGKTLAIGAGIAIVGALILLVGAIQRGLGSRWAMAGLVLGGQFLLIVVGMRADFSRYLLPVLTATAVCGGLVAGAVWDVAWDRFARRRESRRPAIDSSPLAGEPISP